MKQPITPPKLFLAVMSMQPSGIDVQSAADAVKLIKQAQSVRQGLPQAVMFCLPCGKRDKAKNRGVAQLGYAER